MSSTSQAIQTPTSFTTAITKPITMATTAITAVSTIVSNVVTIIQSTPIPTPTATTTGHLPEPSKQSNASSNSSESSSPAPKPWVAEPYYSGTPFIASVANILYMILYTLPLGWNHVMDILFYVQRRREALAKQWQEQKWREETRYHQLQQTNGINQMVELMGQLVANQQAEEKEKAEARDHRVQQTEGINKMVELLGSGLQENKGLKEENKALRQRVQGFESRVEGIETEHKATKVEIAVAVEKGAKEGIKGSLMEASQAMTEAVKVGVKEGFKDALKEASPEPREATKGLMEGMRRVDKRSRKIEYTVLWISSMVNWDCSKHSDQLAKLIKSSKHGTEETDCESESTMKIEIPDYTDSKEWNEEEEEGDLEEYMKEDEDEISFTASTVPNPWDDGRGENHYQW